MFSYVKLILSEGFFRINFYQYTHNATVIRMDIKLAHIKKLNISHPKVVLNK